MPSTRAALTPTTTYIADILAITVFTIFARAAHQSEAMPFTFAGVVSTMWPFLVGLILSWVAVAVLKQAPAGLRPAGIIIWLLTAATGIALVALRNGSLPHISFILVATAMSGLLLLGWRVVVPRLLRR